MRKLILTLLMSAFVICVPAREEEHKRYEIKDSTITLSQAWDGMMRWVVSNEDTYGLRIAYKNPTMGSLIVKGEFRDKMNSLQSVREDLIHPIASFTIEVNYSKGKIAIEMTEANYEYKVGYGDVSSLRTFILNWCKQEMEEIEKIMTYHGEKVNCYDTYFEETAKEYEEKVKEAEKIEADETSPKKERKKANEYLKYNKWRSSPYRYIYYMPIFTACELFYGDKGLEKYIKK